MSCELFVTECFLHTCKEGGGTVRGLRRLGCKSPKIIVGFSISGVPFWNPHNKEYNILGSTIRNIVFRGSFGVPLFRETTNCSVKVMATAAK